jgi:hypothetical protein
VSHSINLMPRQQRGFSLGHYLAATRHATGWNRPLAIPNAASETVLIGTLSFGN